MRKVLAIFFLGVLGYYMFTVLMGFPFGADHLNPSLAGAYLKDTVSKTGAVNVVTSIVVNYRGFDTLGEVTVLFLAATGMGALLYNGKSLNRPRQNASVIVKAGSRLLFPLIIILGAYVFIHGHLTPGGGFQGGAIIASGFLLMFIAYRNYHVSHRILSNIESSAGSIFVILGLLGLLYGVTFLENIMPLGIPNKLFSAGVIPLIYIAVGFKVGAELTALLDTMLKTVK
jgi:multicomponent Na+:H+ antiporter subunit B